MDDHPPNAFAFTIDTQYFDGDVCTDGRPSTARKPTETVSAVQCNKDTGCGDHADSTDVQIVDFIACD